MIEGTLFEHPFTLNRHLQAPLLKEASPSSITFKARNTPLLAAGPLESTVARYNVLKLDKMRDVRLERSKRCKAMEATKSRTQGRRSCRAPRHFYVSAKNGCASTTGLYCRPNQKYGSLNN